MADREHRFYQLYKRHPRLFYDVVSGGNDLSGVGCCAATKGFDEVTGLGVPNLARNRAAPATAIALAAADSDSHSRLA